MTLDDHHLARRLAVEAGSLLSTIRTEGFSARQYPGAIGSRGDHAAHHFLVDELGEHRPDDAVLSEEGRDDLARLGADRVWIVDPLDGSRDFGDPRSAEFAVHVAMVDADGGGAAAVSLPALDEVFSTDSVALATPDRDRPVVVTNRAYGSAGYEVADALDADLVACGSAGVKAMLVVKGLVDVYVHDSGLYEWDVCAPALVAQAAGLHVTDLEGRPYVFNQRRPVVRGVLISRPEYAEAALRAARW